MLEKSILFVDDDPLVIQGLKRTLRPLRNEWQMTFVPSGRAALDLLDKAFFHVVITDLRMGGMDGVTLLETIKQRHSHMIRIVLSGESDRELLIKSTRVSHQFLTKPCEPEVLKAAVTRNCLLFGLLTSDAIKSLAARMENLPSLPTLYAEIMALLDSPAASIRQVGEVISKDLAMTAKILQIVNSSFFGFRRHISEPCQAVALLGIGIVKSLVLSSQIFSQFDLKKMPAQFLDELWRHNLATGALSRKITRAEVPDKIVGDHAFMAGLLHDLGKLVLASNFPDRYRRVLERSQGDNRCLLENETEIFGNTHAEVGAYLLGLWGLPLPIVEALAFHHHPGFSGDRTFTASTAVHIADALENRKGQGPESLLDARYLADLGLSDRVHEWQAIHSGLSSEDAIDET